MIHCFACTRRWLTIDSILSSWSNFYEWSSTICDVSPAGSKKFHETQTRQRFTVFDCVKDLYFISHKCLWWRHIANMVLHHLSVCQCPSRNNADIEKFFFHVTSLQKFGWSKVHSCVLCFKVQFYQTWTCLPSLRHCCDIRWNLQQQSVLISKHIVYFLWNALAVSNVLCQISPTVDVWFLDGAARNQT